LFDWEFLDMKAEIAGLTARFDLEEEERRGQQGFSAPCLGPSSAGARVVQEWIELIYMLTLAIEQSTARCSAAILEDTAVQADRSWIEDRRRSQQLFSILPELLDSASLSSSDIDVFAVGLGPGSFSGLRIALSAARAMALPGQKKVFGVSSAEALALEIHGKHNAGSVTIVGDARRDLLWSTRFNPDGTCHQAAAISLHPASELASIVENSAVVASPDWDRIGKPLRRAVKKDAVLIEEQCSPSAVTIGRQSFVRIEKGEDSLPLTPLYLHPAARLNPIDSGGT
jgi:tRNA threonylcarbamoyladenosine biosynthesis protein TsaB